MRDDGDGILHQAGAVPSEAEAQKVCDVWTAEGRREPMAINLVPVYNTAEELQADPLICESRYPLTPQTFMPSRAADVRT
jgi:hypothetical protein